MSSTAPVQLEPKLPGETVVRPVDFTARLPAGVTVTSIAAVVSVWAGEDAAFADVLPAQPASAALVSLKLTAGVAGVFYLVTVTATCSDGEVLIEERLLQVVASR